MQFKGKQRRLKLQYDSILPKGGIVQSHKRFMLCVQFVFCFVELVYELFWDDNVIVNLNISTWRQNHLQKMMFIQGGSLSSTYRKPEVVIRDEVNHV